jgi:hypothetical protein
MTARGAGVIVMQGGAIAESRTHLSSQNPHPGRSGRDVAHLTNAVPALSQAPLP